MNWVRIAKEVLVGSGATVVPLLIAEAQRARERGEPWRQRLMLRLLERCFGVYVSESARIGPRLWTPHPVGIVIGSGVVIGSDCRLYQGVTLGRGSLEESEADAYPTIGDRVVVFANAVVVGNCRVGDDAIIGANAVVLHDVPAGRTAVGIPAKTL
mgnify:CR=1 FL=1